MWTQSAVCGRTWASGSATAAAASTSSWTPQSSEYADGGSALLTPKAGLHTTQSQRAAVQPGFLTYQVGNLGEALFFLGGKKTQSDEAHETENIEFLVVVVVKYEKSTWSLMLAADNIFFESNGGRIQGKQIQKRNKGKIKVQ